MEEIVEVIFHKEEKVQGIVVGNDPDIGITIISKNDPDHFLLCFSGPLSRIMIHREPSACRHWPEIYEFTAKMIKVKKICLDSIVSLVVSFDDPTYMWGIMLMLIIVLSDSRLCQPERLAETVPISFE